MTWIVVLLLGGYAGALGLLYVKQRTLMYFPDGESLAAVLLPPGFQRVQSETADGLRLTHLYRPPAEPQRGVMLVFHGNGGNAGGRLGKYLELLPDGMGLLLAEYRGYGGNPGSSTEAGLVADARSTLAWLEDQAIAPGHVVLYGESLGSGVATAIAAEQAAVEREVAGVVLEAPFLSMGRAAQHHYWYVPARWLVRDRYDSLARIAVIGAPLLIVHGRQDRTVPFAQGEGLFVAAVQPKSFLPVPTAGHVDLYEHDGVTTQVTDWLAEVRGF